MTPEELVNHYPVLLHMAERGSWPRIRRLGLRTTRQLVDACDPDPTTRAAILGRPRSRSYELTHPAIGPVTIRDQKPLKLHNLEPKLTDVTVEGFLDLLNDRVFMWTHPTRLDRLLAGRYYRNTEHDVLVLDTARLIESYYDNIRLTTMNTGATIFPTSPRRGAESFMTIADFPFADRRRVRSLEDAVVELCVIGGVDNVEEFVIRVERRQGPDVLGILYRA